MELNSINLAPGILLHLIQGGSTSLDALPPRAVALDGYVQGPVLGDDQDRYSFDHHGGCQRLITDATCAQVWSACQLGFDWQKRHVFVNDLDADTVLSLFLIMVNNDGLNGIRLATVHMQDKLARLTRCIGLLDAHGPAAFRLMSQQDSRLAKAYHAGPMAAIYDRDKPIQERFEEWPALLGEAMDQTQIFLRLDFNLVHAPEKPVEYNILFDNVTACLATSEGWAFEALYESYDIVVLMQDAAKRSNRYTIGKVSDLVPFNMQGLLKSLNEIEHGWGGGSSIGGSPRLDGGVSSYLSPEYVWAALCAEMES